MGIIIKLLTKKKKKISLTYFRITLYENNFLSAPILFSKCSNKYQLKPHYKLKWQHSFHSYTLYIFFFRCQYSNTKNHFWHLSLLLNMQMLADIYQTNLTDCICCMQQHILTQSIAKQTQFYPYQCELMHIMYVQMYMHEFAYTYIHKHMYVCLYA